MNREVQICTHVVVTCNYLHKQVSVVHADVHTTAQDFKIGDTVYFRDYSSRTASRWSAGTIMAKTGPLSYKI